MDVFRNNAIVVFYTLVFMVLFSSCQEGETAYTYASATESAEDADASPAMQERKIIKTGRIVFETTALQETKTFVSQHTAEYKGYIAKETVYKYDDEIRQYITVRIPSHKFELLLDSISQRAGKLDQRSVEVRDVTEEYIDVEVRVSTKKALENRYRELLKQAVKVEEILSIEKEIGSLRTEIEVVEGRLNYLRDQVAFSTLNIEFYERTSSSFGFGNKLSQALRNGWTNFLWFVVGLITIWPFWLVGGFAGLLLYRRWRQRRKLKK